MSDSRAPKLRNVLVPAGSPASLAAALRYARMLAEGFGGRITILFAGPGADTQSGLQAMAETTAREAGIDDGHLRAIFACPGTLSLARVYEAARCESADLMVISADFHLGTTHFLQESTLEKIIHHAPCPVLVVGNHVRPG